MGAGPGVTKKVRCVSPGGSGLLHLPAPRWEGDQAGAWLDLPQPNSSSQEETELDFLVVQQLGLCTSTARGLGSVTRWGTKIPHAARCNQKKEKKVFNLNKTPQGLSIGFKALFQLLCSVTWICLISFLPTLLSPRPTPAHVQLLVSHLGASPQTPPSPGPSPHFSD